LNIWQKRYLRGKKRADIGFVPGAAAFLQRGMGVSGNFGDVLLIRDAVTRKIKERKEEPASAGSFFSHVWEFNWN
jgi:hypothetical protein